MNFRLKVYCRKKFELPVLPTVGLASLKFIQKLSFGFQFSCNSVVHDPCLSTTTYLDRYLDKRLQVMHNISMHSGMFPKTNLVARLKTIQLHTQFYLYINRIKWGWSGIINISVFLSPKAQNYFPCTQKRLFIFLTKVETIIVYIIKHATIFIQFWLVFYSHGTNIILSRIQKYF